MVDNPFSIIVIAFILLVLGVLLPFLMLIQVLESTFFLNFLSFSLSTAGLFVGVLGLAGFIRTRKK